MYILLCFYIFFALKLFDFCEHTDILDQVIFADEYDEFNAYVAENIDRITKRPSKEVKELQELCVFQTL